MEVSEGLHNSFKNWLNTLGYAESTVYNSVNYVRDFFNWLNDDEKIKLPRIENQVIQNYSDYLQKRRNKRYPGSLSNNYILSNINALKRFSRYLEQTDKGSLEINLKLKPERANKKTNPKLEEIKSRYKSCTNDELGMQNRAILSIFYGCGLRRSEGQALNVTDILLKEKRVFVRKGKNYRERYVPMAESVKSDLENYIYLTREQNNQALFLGRKGNDPMCGAALYGRVKKLSKIARIQKKVGLHTLRHSIATHLLQSGMTLEEVSQFLGHASLESTQIYTHLAHEI